MISLLMLMRKNAPVLPLRAAAAHLSQFIRQKSAKSGDGHGADNEPEEKKQQGNITLDREQSGEVSHSESSESDFDFCLEECEFEYEQYLHEYKVKHGLEDKLIDPLPVSLEDDFLVLTPNKTIQEIKDMNQTSLCIVLATIKLLAPPGEWWYPSCKFNKKVTLVENMYYCENCDRNIFSMTPKYHLVVRVTDHQESALFVIFDQEASVLLGKSCAELINKPYQSTGSSALPEEIALLMNKCLLFKIEVKNSSSSGFEPSYNVKKICADPDIINRFKEIHHVSYDGAITAPIVDLSRDSEDMTPAKCTSPTLQNEEESSNLKKKSVVAIKKEKI